MQQFRAKIYLENNNKYVYSKFEDPEYINSINEISEIDKKCKSLSDTQHTYISHISLMEKYRKLDRKFKEDLFELRNELKDKVEKYKKDNNINILPVILYSPNSLNVDSSLFLSSPPGGPWLIKYFNKPWTINLFKINGPWGAPDGDIENIFLNYSLSLLCLTFFSLFLFVRLKNLKSNTSLLFISPRPAPAIS